MCFYIYQSAGFSYSEAIWIGANSEREDKNNYFCSKTVVLPFDDQRTTEEQSTHDILRRFRDMITVKASHYIHCHFHCGVVTKIIIFV